MDMKTTKRLLLILGFLLPWISATAQITVKGNVVLKSDGEPVIGATVRQADAASNATATDFNGDFTLVVPEGASVQISYVGCKTTTVRASAQLSVTLEEDSEILDEVIVVGYNTQRKVDVTGAISAIDINDMAKQNENNPIKALQGRVPGVNISADGGPSGSATVRIRGVGTLNNNDPLYIIDGVPTKGGMHELNPGDIESIQILKDAASASIYGSRAANGVIIITTKRGKGIQINLDASIAAQFYVNRMNVLNAEEYGRAMWQAYVNDGQDPNTNGLGYRYDWGYDRNGYPQLNSISMSKYLDAAGTTPAADTDWFDETTRTGMVQNYNFSAGGSTDKMSAFFSLGYYQNLGVIKYSDFERFSARINTEFKPISDILTIGEHFTVNRTDEVQAPGGFLENVLQANPSLPVYTTDGEFAGPVGGYPDRENPLARLIRNKDNRYAYWRMFGDAYINLAPFKGFNLRTTFGIDYSQKQQRIFTYPVTEGNVANSTNAVEAKQEHWLRWMWNLVASYNIDFGRNHLDALLGMELNRETSNWFSGYKTGFSILNTDFM